MSFSRRWYHAFWPALVVLLSGYFFDLRHLLDKSAALSANERQLKLLAEPQQIFTPQLQDEPDVDADELAQFYRLLEEYHLILHAVAAAGDDSYQLTVSGVYDDLRMLLDDWPQRRKDDKIAAFTLTPVRQRIRLEVLLSLASGENAPLAMAKKQRRANPFCNSGFMLPAGKKALYFLLDEMRMLGTLQYQQKISAVMQMPDGSVAVIQPGALLGSEGGRVEVIKDTSLSVIFPDQRRRVIKLI
jgi:Tfp pilus assembly protein PilP